MRKRTITKANVAPVTVDQAREWCRIDAGEDEVLLEGLLLAATTAAEAETGRDISDAVVELSFDSGRRYYSLPIAPIREVTSVELEACDGTRTTVGPADWWFGKDNLGGAIHFNTCSPCGHAVVITVEVGYEDATDAPQAIKQAIAIHAANAYAGREGQDLASATFRNLLAPYRVSLL